MKILFSILILAAPIAIYIWIIRPRLRARFVDTYAHLDSFWGRSWARIKAFRTWIIGGVGLYASELPALLETFNAIDLTSLPPYWQSTVRVLTIVAIMVSRAYSTTPANASEKP